MILIAVSGDIWHLFSIQTVSESLAAVECAEETIGLAILSLQYSNSNILSWLM